MHVVGPRTFKLGTGAFTLPRRIGWETDLLLMEAENLLAAAKDDPVKLAAAVRAIQAACWAALAPTGWFRRLVYRLLPNPLRHATPYETAQVLGFVRKVQEIDARATVLTQVGRNSYQIGPPAEEA